MASFNYDETMDTLRYASRAKRIKNKMKSWEQYDLALSKLEASLAPWETMRSAVNLCRTYVNDSRTSDETKEKVGNILAILEGTEFNQRNKEEVLSPDGLDTNSEADPPSGCGDEMSHVIHTVQPSAPPITGTSGSAEELDKVPLPCIAASTPSKNSKGQLGVIADYTPNTHPMVPALIQHCVNEIEIRGLTREGLYRVRGLELLIKELKDRFLRGKGVPNLSIYDPHVICGCIKDFLRSLREPLVGCHFWRDFALATDISDPIKRQIEIHRALEKLPPPNQDTLAFVVLHLQRVAKIEVVKMPLSNMAEVFGPSLIGYSVGELDANNILPETRKQQLILSTLLSMSSEYWTKFLKRSEPIPLVEANSGPTTRQDYTRKKIRNSNGPRQIEASGAMEQVVSKTVVSIPRSGGPIHATSTLETVPSSGYGDEKTTHVIHVQPSAPPMTGTSESESDQHNVNFIMKPPRYPTRASISKNTTNESPRFGRTLSATSGQMKNHSWVTKTIVAPETCGQCYKRIHFAKITYKCKSCKATCHPDCKDKVPLPCIAASTPSKNSKGQLGVIADYTPNTHPMVPALIQYCVNEIEIRGLTHEGLYRVRGLEREIKELKDRFLRGKGVPNLSIYDPHVICGCIKDFLRSLREPLVGRHFWRDFALATDISDPMKRQIEINRALEKLPPPNQDTLAFVVLHLQRVAEIEVVKMPLSNMAKVFGPSLIGYSVGEVDANNILQETRKQQLILSTLLSMSSEYWTKFLKRSEPIPLVEVNSGPTTRQRTSRFSSVGRARGGTLTNSTTSQVQALAPIQAAYNKTSSKKIYVHDVSSQRSAWLTSRSQTNTRPKRNYFD